jgi:hypothetical protein
MVWNALDDAAEPPVAQLHTSQQHFSDSFHAVNSVLHVPMPPEQQLKHHKDSEAIAAAALQHADHKARDAQLRASELQHLERLLGATVAVGGLRHLDLRELNVCLQHRLQLICCFVIYGHLWSFMVIYGHLWSFQSCFDCLSQLSRIPHSLFRRFAYLALPFRHICSAFITCAVE